MKTDYNARYKQLVAQYPVLGRPTIIGDWPEKGILNIRLIVDLMDEAQANKGRVLYEVAQHTVGAGLNIALKSKKSLERMRIIQDHFDLALVFLDEGQNYEGTICNNAIAGFEKARILALQKVAKDTRSNADVWNYYATWMHDHLGKYELTQSDVESWYRKAIDAGNTDSMNGLAVLLYSSATKDGGEDIEESVNLWQNAAQKGHLMAIENLAQVLEADDTFTISERQQCIKTIWQGVSQNRSGSSETIIKKLQAAGLVLREVTNVPQPA